MTSPNITTEQASKCFWILESAEEPIVAVDIARKLNLPGNRETQRRHVRAIIEHLRKGGAWIVGFNPDGYFLTKDPQLWRDYLVGRQIDAKQVLGITHKQKKMLTDPKGQGLLFQPPRIVCGCATMGVD